jgi:hypothetical protein
MGSALPKVASKNAYGHLGHLGQVCMPKVRVSPCLPRTMHIMHSVNLHMHAEQSERTIREIASPGALRRRIFKPFWDAPLALLASRASPAAGLGRSSDLRV